MLKKTITYDSFSDVDGQTKDTADFYFNLTKMEIIEINLVDELSAVGKSKDPKRIIPALKRIVRAAVGQRIGDRFVKSEEFADAFIASDAYSELFMEILGSENAEEKMAAFVRGIVPEGIQLSQDSLPVTQDATK